VSLHPFTEGLVAVHTHGNQAFGRKEPKLGGGCLLVIFPAFAQTGYYSTFPSLSQRDMGGGLQIWELASSRSDGANSQIKWKRSLTAAPRVVE